jgi:hypothetical protein
MSAVGRRARAGRRMITKIFYCEEFLVLWHYAVKLTLARGRGSCSVCLVRPASWQLTSMIVKDFQLI